jgi:type IV pilus assembly protein PilB
MFRPESGRAGIRLAEERSLRIADGRAERAAAELCREAKTLMVVVKTKRLGQILIEAGLLTPEQLEFALKEQAQTHEKLGSLLQRLGICTEREIARVLAAQAGVACVELSGIEPDAAAIERIPLAVAEKYNALPLSQKGDSLRVAMANPLDLDGIDALGRATGCYIEVVHAPEREILEAMERWYGGRSDASADISAAIETAKRALESGVNLGESDSPFIRLVDLLLRQGIDAGATDVHLEPEEKVLRCRYRLDGRLIQGAILPRELHSIVVTRLKILAEMNISETRVPQDGRILFTIGRRTVDLRVSTFPTVHGEGVVLRVLDKEQLIVGLERLGMPEDCLAEFRRDIQRPHGILLVTGPTGSGKTTTLYAALSFINKPDTKIITLEDPVEYELPVINQAQINVAKGFTFAKGLRAILRQDPDVILVGEIRDQETAQMAIRAALTGHLVFSTLHTNSAAGAIPRLLDMGIERFLLSATLVGVLAQRLVRQVCPDCAEPVPLDAEQQALLGIDPADAVGAHYSSGTGCERCRQTGYRGRQAVFEYLPVTADIRRLINDGGNAEVIAAATRESGVRTLRENALAKLSAGITSAAEILRVVA